MFPNYILGCIIMLFVLRIQAQENELKVLHLLDDVTKILEKDLSDALLTEDQFRTVTNITKDFQNAISSVFLQNTTLSDLLVLVDFQNIYNRLFSIVTRQKRHGKSKGHGHNHHQVCPPPIIPPPPQPDTRIMRRITDLEQAARSLRNAIDDVCTRITEAIARQQMLLMGLTSG